MMATAGASLLPSKEKANFLRLAALVIDGGTLALKTQFDLVFPPPTLGQDLQDPANFRIILKLKNRKIIKQAQYDLLIPPPHKVADSSDFDVTLLSCLIQNLLPFGQQHSPVWTQPGPPAANDFSLAAEVKRLRYLRNYISHPPNATISDQGFRDKWKETSDIIQRLCVTVPGIQNCIDDILKLSLDPEKEQEYIDKLNEFDDFDARITKQEKQSTAILQSLKEQKDQVDTSQAIIRNIGVDLGKVEHDVGIVKEDVKRSDAKADRLNAGLEKVIKKTDAMQADQETRSKMSSEFRALISRSKVYFEERERNEFVETTIYTKALEILESKKVVVLSGHPGEGKTTMAKHLLKRYQPDRCINLTEPENWKHVDFSLNLIDAILIDDIFGSGVLDENLVKKWERQLDDMSKIITEKDVNVVITSRHYILEETKQLFRSLPLFKKENTQQLSSNDLTHEEKMQILEAHLKAARRLVEPDIMNMCVMMHASVLENILFGTNEFLFGFPECVNLFARQDDLFEKGPNFFSQPNIFVKSCIKQLYENEEKFLALIVMWANKGHILNKSELDESNLSHRLSKIAKKFKFKMKGKLIKKLRKSLDYHVGGLLHFSKESGTYSFSHNVICDMVGLVIAEENPDEVLEFCTREFLLTYVTTESTDDEFKFCVDEYLFNDLADRLIDLMVGEKSILGLIDCSFSIVSLNRGGKMKSSVKPSFNFDFSIVKHESFQNEDFVDVFLNALVKNGNIQSLFGTEIMELSGFFLRYGLKINQQKYFLLSYSVFIGAEMFAKRVSAQNFLDQTELSKEQKEMEYTMSLFFAVHHQMSSLVECLLRKDAIVTDEVLYIAAHKLDMNILKQLLSKYQCRRELDNVETLNGNNALIVAAKKGFADAVRCFITSGYDLTARNKDGLSALDKAIAFGHEDVCELLVNAGVPLNKPTRKFKRHPIHTAVDKGLISATKCLIANGSSLINKDHKGFYPIHTAALNRHFEIVHYLLEHDPRQASLLTKTYGTKSVLKGKSVFHIALHKKDKELLKVLLSTKANPNVTDWFGCTVFLEAILKSDSEFIDLLKDIADMTIPDQNGFTPLHVAVYKGYASLVHTICSNPSVNVNARDKYGKTALHISAIKGFSEIFLALAFMYRADWRMITNRGDTILHLAIRNRKCFERKKMMEDLRSMFEVLQQQHNDVAAEVQPATENDDTTDQQQDETTNNRDTAGQTGLLVLENSLNDDANRLYSDDGIISLYSRDSSNRKNSDNANVMLNANDDTNRIHPDDVSIMMKSDGYATKIDSNSENITHNSTDDANIMDLDNITQNPTDGAHLMDLDISNILQNPTDGANRMDLDIANITQNSTDGANKMDSDIANITQNPTDGANITDLNIANIPQNLTDGANKMDLDIANITQNPTDNANRMDSDRAKIKQTPSDCANSIASDDANIMQKPTDNANSMNSDGANILQSSIDDANVMNSDKTKNKLNPSDGANRMDFGNGNRMLDHNDGAQGVDSENSIDGANRMDSDDPNIMLRNSIISDLIRDSFTQSNDHTNSKQSEDDNNGHRQEAAQSLDLCKTTMEGYKTIINVIATFDNDFLEKELANKYGQKIIFGART